MFRNWNRTWLTLTALLAVAGLPKCWNMQPECINSVGQISGNFRIDNSTFGEAFLLTPVSP